MGVGATIRRAGARDAVSVDALVAAAYEPYVAVIGRRPAPTDEDYREVLDSSDSWVAEIEGRVVAVLVTRPYADHLLIENVAVSPTAQGHGLGGRLLALAERHARTLGIGEVRLYTNAAMVANLDFYARRGFRETGRGEQDGFRRVFFTKPVHEC